MKLKQKTMKRIQGSISILLVLIMLPMMTFAAVIVDLSRINMARQMVSSAGSLAMNSQLTTYDTILKDVYGLFAMSQSKEEAADRVQDYFERTLVSYKVVEKAKAEEYVQNLIGDFHELLAATDETEVKDFLRLKNVTATATGIPSSSLGTPDILRKQIVEYMKYRAPIEFGMSFLDALKSFDTVGDQTKVVESQVKAQESTQDVTQACSKLIGLIRDYDDLVENINKYDPEQVLTSIDDQEKPLPVELVDYDTHMSLLRDGTNNLRYHFKHLNRINLVFLDNNPNVDNVYLKNLDIGQNVYYIPEDGMSLVHDNSGISFTVDNLAGDLESALNQMKNQITSLNNTYLTFANNYINQNFISEAYIATDPSDNTLYFTDEAAAITSFGTFEKFLLNQAEIKYDDPNGNVDVKGTLDEIYRLSKYFENYKALMQPKLTAAKTAWENALGVLTQRKQERHSVKLALASCVGSINSTTSSAYPDLQSEDILTFLNDQDRTEILEVLAQLPAFSEGTHWAYFTNHLSDGGGANNYDYYFTWLTKNGSLKDNAVGKAAKDYTGSAADFEKHMKEKAGSDVVKKDEYKLLKCLLQCSEYAETFYSKCSEYDTADQNVAAAQTDADNKEATYRDLEAALQNAQTLMANCMKQFRPFVMTYQKDAYTFGRYIQTAKDVVDDHIAVVQVNYLQMRKNITALSGQLQAILTQIDTTQTAIEKYNEFLDAWEKENNTYIANNGADSFSKQVEADIATCRSEYDDALFVDLENFVTELKGRFDAFDGYLTNMQKNCYGHYHMSMIVSPEVAMEAVEGLRGSESIVTAQMADEKFDSLFPATPYGEFDPYTVSAKQQLGFLRPTVVQLQILKYLDNAYPREEETSEPEGEEKEEQVPDAEDQYNELTKDLNDNSGGSVEDTDDVFTKEGDGAPDSGSGSNKYGYTYMNEGKSVPKDGVPSKDFKPKGVSGTQFKLSKDEEKVNVSGGMSAQTGVMDQVLANIGKAVNAGMENLYILSYVFENFSYNTMVQDAMVEADSNRDADHRIIGQDPKVTDAIKLANDTELLNDVKDKVPMLSGGYVKNGKNNFLYGAEVEYILYGNQNAKTNVTSAKASIYAVRFGFNCIYAFTDSNIRNMTMSAGLAVQAATLGIVPYQVVQVVLQLALAAAESALDLEMMNCGLRVAVVKSKDTWLLSVSSAADALADIAADAASTVIKDLTTGVQDLVDSSADELKNAIGDLQESITTSTRKAMEDIMNQSIGRITKAVEEKLNELQYITESSLDKVNQEVDNAFAGLETQLETELRAMFAGNDLADQVLELVIPEIDDIIKTVKEDIKTQLNAPATDANEQVQDYGARLIAQMNKIKANMIETVTDKVDTITSALRDKADALVEEIEGSLKDYAAQAGEEISEEVAEEIRTEVADLANGFIDEYLGGGAGIGTDQVGANSSLAAAIKFGYKDYLMLFTYISICVNDDEVLLRTADLIQLNLQKAGEGAQFQHKQGANFKMSEAFTYVLVEGSADMDLLLMDFSIFADIVAEDSKDAETDTDTDTDTAEEEGETLFPIKYFGMLGY